MIREFKIEDLDEVNKLLDALDYKLEEKAFDNVFLKVIVYIDSCINGVLVYQNLIDRLTIDYVVVDCEYRNKGIATSLIKFMEQKHNNVLNTTLEVRKSNAAARNFYNKNGFKEVAIRKNYYKNEDGILMIKEYR